jgi:hypothetical protein
MIHRQAAGRLAAPDHTPRRLDRRAAAFVALLLPLLAASALAGPPTPKENDATTDNGLGSEMPPSAGVSRDSMEAMLNGRRVTRLLSGYVLVNRSGDDPEALGITKSVDPFVEFEGRIIRDIRIEQYDIFGYTEADTGRSSFASFIDRIHMDTRQSIIEGYLLMRSGDPLDPYTLSDTERILRSTAFIHDARITLLAVPGTTDSVDVVVSTQDIWSIGVGGALRTATSYRVNVFDRNLIGRGLNLDFGIDYDEGRIRQLDYDLQLVQPNLFGTYITAGGRLHFGHAENLYDLRFTRSQLAPQIDVTGGLAFTHRDTKIAPNDSLFISESSDTQDTWLGWSTPLESLDWGAEGRVLFNVAGRITNTNYQKRPPETMPELFRGFHDRQTVLASASIYRSDYRKGRMIFGYGRIEDVPYGFVGTLTVGREFKEFGNRWYAGFGFRSGSYDPKYGYLLVDAEVGAFKRKDYAQDGAFDIGLGYFTNLIPFGKFRLRHFMATSFTQGIGREWHNLLYLRDVPNLPGLHDLTESELSGRHRFNLSMEPILFTPWTYWGFRTALFGFASVNMMSQTIENVSAEKYYPVFGGGLRVHNEHMVLSPYELRIAYTSSPLPGRSETRITVKSAPFLRIPGFAPGAPSIVQYQ